jgi:hypothetical protein
LEEAAYCWWDAESSLGDQSKISATAIVRPRSVS